MAMAMAMAMAVAMAEPVTATSTVTSVAVAIMGTVSVAAMVAAIAVVNVTVTVMGACNRAHQDNNGERGGPGDGRSEIGRRGRSNCMINNDRSRGQIATTGIV